VRAALNIAVTNEIGPPCSIVQGGTVWTAMNIYRLQTWRMRLDLPLD
jgi:hypothetical protein